MNAGFLKQMMLLVKANNAQALRLYTSLGYQVTSPSSS